MLQILVIFLPVLMQVRCCIYTVETSKGPIVGQKATDGSYKTYFGVPYAQVVKTKPFENTMEYPNFISPFIASDPNVKCPQAITTVGGILQCLRLNIYVPISQDNSTNLPVYVWFHGGGLAFGSGGEYNATHLVQKNIIVVTANYRLGPYGFLCTSKIQNQGLKDMRNALKWIRNNIRAFGGNSDKVTIGGESWGAAAVDFLLYEQADFHQAIMESGSRFSFPVSTRVDEEAVIKLANKLKFNTTDHKEALKFLNSADPVDVMQASKNLSLVFGVCEKPGNFHHLGNIKTAPILVGYNSKEMFQDYVTKPDSFYETVEGELIKNVGKLFNLPKDQIENLANIILRFYLAGKKPSRETMLELIDLSSDFVVNDGAERSVSNYLKFGNPNVYKYVFSYTGSSPYQNMTGVGAYHTEELPFLFELGILKTEEQLKMRDFMVTLWTNFIKYGNPTPDDDVDQPTWLPCDPTTRTYLNIDTRSEIRSQVYHQRIAFWDLLWAGFGRYRK